MKKTTLLHAAISNVIAQLGHGNTLCIGDAGLPIPAHVERVDLAVSPGVPSLLGVFAAVTSEMFVERVVIAKQLKDQQPQFMEQVLAAIRSLEVSQNNTITIDFIDHIDLKQLTTDCKASVRTGECTPFANIILYAGVTF
jgi:D-ribose pyranase